MNFTGLYMLGFIVILLPFLDKLSLFFGHIEHHLPVSVIAFYSCHDYLSKHIKNALLLLSQ